MKHMGTELLSVEQAATYLGVNRLTVRRRIASGDIPAYRLGPRLIRIRPEDLDALLRPIPSAKVF